MYSLPFAEMNSYIHVKMIEITVESISLLVVELNSDILGFIPFPILYKIGIIIPENSGLPACVGMKKKVSIGDNL
jgi:hypothetical protein